MIKKILIIIGSTAIFLIALYFGIDAYTNYKIGYTNVYVASHQISQRTKISEEDLTILKIPKDCIKNDVLINKEDIIDKYVKLSYSIPKGSFIYKSAIEENIMDYSNTLLKENEVNYDIYTSDVKINTANIANNMLVDIYLTINSKDKPVSDLLLSNVRITGLYDHNNKPIHSYDNESRVNVVSLAINKDDVGVLNKAQIVGTLNFVINKNTYNTNMNTKLNSDSVLFDYLN